MTQLLPPKKEVALALLERSNVDVYLDPRAKGVVVPPQFRKEPRLILKIGLNMPVPIPDLRLDDESMSCTLSFNRAPFYCVVPWTSVFAMVGEDGRGMVWPDDVPPEIASQAPVEQQPPARPRPAAAKRALEPVRSEAPPDEKPKAKKGSRSKKPRIVAVEPATPERPVLVALPPPPEPRGPRAVPSEKKRPHPQRPATGGGGGKGKRELPPYLRVVK